MTEIKKAQAIRRQNQLEEEDADLYVQLVNSKWQQQVSKIAHFNYQQNKFNQVKR